MQQLQVLVGKVTTNLFSFSDISLQSVVAPIKILGK